MSDKPRVTVAAVAERDGRFLLVEEETRRGRLYNQPAGHLESGESLLDAVAREALEETAHDFAPTALLGIYLYTSPAESRTYLRVAFAGNATDRVPQRALDRGIVRAVWMTPAEAKECAGRHRSPLVMRCIDDHLSGQRYPLALLHHYPLT